MVEREGADLPLTVQAELLGLSRSSLYYRPVPPSPDEVALRMRRSYVKPPGEELARQGGDLLVAGRHSWQSR
jgi:hypothetical protein